MSELKLPIERLGEKREAFDYEVDAAWWAAREASTRDELSEVEQPFRFHLEACRVREDVLIEGRIIGRVGLECSRCAKRYPHALATISGSCWSRRRVTNPWIRKV